MIKGILSGALFESVFEVQKPEGFMQIARCTRDFKDMFKKGDIARWVVIPSKNIDRFDIVNNGRF